MPRDNSLVSLSDLMTRGFSGTSSPVDLDLSPRAYIPVTNKSEAPPTNRPSSLTSSVSRELNDHGPTNKGEEPYAQLIYRAFMSRPDYSMTLQEIYQWFRENTDKAKSESKGWQNSIRHNLSMNAVSNNVTTHPRRCVPRIFVLDLGCPCRVLESSCMDAGHVLGLSK
jgi:hypothetical protein